MSYAFPPGGLPDQSQNPESTAVFTESYAVIPACTQRDIVTSFLPGWQNTRVWVLARPLSGFAETFAQYAVELDPEGGSNDPEPDKDAQAMIFIADGQARLTLGQDTYDLRPGSYVYLPPAAVWTLFNPHEAPCRFHWIRKKFEPAPGINVPEAFVTHEQDVPAIPMPDCGDLWSTQRFMDPLNLEYDFHVNLVNFQPGGRIPFAETHVMEHGLYVLQGTAEYLLNTDWVSVGPGDFLWLRAFCPQACIATGSEPFRYLLYKDVNRHMRL
ncbi:bifunctional allantoicase/(S)-ureidoglycine aminohydrolase [uncultured Roseobacter sp.]|uniref:bifunctional allantoicase/(S)-ureidoglycine aminohydrolase n=1 Tax=uncultured Roseobacter sp. TaxID=114847 RepID=UPI0026152CA9|nr:bifunctional allantoicase/(S)-ureidoglycine aminohydrolase [uncultured Roseobacter sp.]